MIPDVIHHECFSIVIIRPAAQRFALLAGGRAWIRLREQDSVRAWKMPENGAESHPSSARFVRRGVIKGYG